MGSNGPLFGLICYDDTCYEGWIGSSFALVNKGVLIIMQGYTKDCEQSFQIGLID